jgi:small subunit ribosomal protein S3
MGQKINPNILRINVSQKPRTQWFAKPKEYAKYLQEDKMIRDFLEEQLTGKNSTQSPSSVKTLKVDAGLSKTLLSRRAGRLLVEIHVAQPKIVTGEGGARLKELTEGIQKIQQSYAQLRARTNYNMVHMNQVENTGIENSTSVSLHVVQVEQPATDATLVAQKVAQQLEKRVAFRRAMKQAIQQACEAGVEGIKIQIAGRLNGAEIARTEWAREGRVPLHTLRANIDYCAYPAQTIYGLLGIKVWIYKNS